MIDMKLICTGLVLALLSVSVYAEVDSDTARKLAAVKFLALSGERISPQQVSKALAVQLKRRCTDVVQAGAGKYHVCIYDTAEEDKQPLAFRHYKTVSRTGGHEHGGVVMFLTQGDHYCLRSEDLVKVFGRAPVQPNSPAMAEPVLPNVPTSTYQFVFPNQGDTEVHVRVVQTGECINTVELNKDASQSRIEK